MHYSHHNIWLQLLFCYAVCNIPKSVTAAKTQQPMRSMQFLSASTKFNPVHMENITAYIVNGTLNMEMISRKDIVQGHKTLVNLQISISNPKRYQTVIAYEFDTCQLLSNIFRSSFLQNLMKNMLKHSNANQNCPIEAGYYYVHGLIMEPKSIPAYLRAGDYRVITHHFYGKRGTKSELMVVRFMTDLRIN